MSLKKWISVHIPTPSYMSMRHVGVDISSTCIHVIEIHRKGSGFKLGKYGVEYFTTPIDYSGSLVENADLLQALKNIQKKFKLQFVEISIPEDKAYIFTMNIPYESEEKILNHIEFHLEENVPISLSDAVYDYHIIEHSPSKPIVEEKKPEEQHLEKNTLVTLLDRGSGISVETFLASVSVVPKNIIDQYIEVFELAGMTPVSFLVENQALSKSIIKKNSKDTLLIVHIGEKKSVISIVSNGSVHFTSTVSIGSEDFTSAIMKEFSVSRDEAVRMKSEKGYGTDINQSTVFMSLINTASALKDEIDKVILYWQSYVAKRGRITEHSVTGLILSGHDAEINGIREYLLATIKLPVQTANVWINIYEIEKHIPEIPYIDSLDYAVAIGLGLPKLN